MPANEVIYCMVNPKGGPVSVALRANNALLTGSDFAVWQADGDTKREDWKLSAGTAGVGTHDISAASNSLDGGYLTWEVTVCSAKTAVDSGAVEITVSQDGVSCPLTKNLHWDLEEIPQCETGQVTSIRRYIMFRNS